jgi:hypothetical protein
MDVLMEMLKEMSLGSLSDEWMAKQTVLMMEKGLAQLSEMSLERLLAGLMAIQMVQMMAQMTLFPKDLLRVQKTS